MFATGSVGVGVGVVVEVVVVEAVVSSGILIIASSRSSDEHPINKAEKTNTKVTNVLFILNSYDNPYKFKELF
jgi:hypothetical protein